MKKFIKDNFKIIMTAFITAIICISGTVTASILINARDISFTSTNANFNASNVNDAMDELFNEAQKEQKYSTDEIEIGTWIDGKKVYRKVLNVTINKTFQDRVATTIYDLKNDIENIDTVITYSGRSSYGNYVDSSWGEYYFLRTVGTEIITNRSIMGNASFLLIVEYTKTTDEVE